MAKKNGKQTESNDQIKPNEPTEPKAITLSIEDRRWYENLVLKEQLIRRQAQDNLRQIALESEEMMQALSKREGVDLKGYQINWQTGAALPSPKESAHEQAQARMEDK